jgi:hypothetical protein
MTMRGIATMAGLVLAGCATATIEDAVPAGALTQTAAETTTQAEEAAPERAPTAGLYPNLNVAAPAAAPQLTAQEKSADTADLRAKREALARGERAPDAKDTEKELSDLAAGHGNAVLKEIERR